MSLRSVASTLSGGKTRRKSRANYQVKVPRQVRQVRWMVLHKILHLGSSMPSLAEALANLVRKKLTRLEIIGVW